MVPMPSTRGPIDRFTASCVLGLLGSRESVSRLGTRSETEVTNAAYNECASPVTSSRRRWPIGPSDEVFFLRLLIFYGTISLVQKCVENRPNECGGLGLCIIRKPIQTYQMSFDSFFCGRLSKPNLVIDMVKKNYTDCRHPLKGDALLTYTSK